MRLTVVRLLLDTHSIVWWLQDDPRLSEAAKAAIAGGSSAVYVSAVSAWEIATKVRLRKMPEMEEAIHHYEEDIAEEGFQRIAIQQQHSLRAGSLESDHGDPFDRMLAAQAIIEQMTLVTRDRHMPAFGCETLW